MDASLLSWGGDLGYLSVQGRWSAEENLLPINILELRMISHALRLIRNTVNGKNPIYPPAVENSQASSGNAVPVNMPPPPQYSEHDPAAFSSLISNSHLEMGNIPKPDVEDGPPEYSINIGDSSPFSESAIRRAFIRKVYITLAIQLTITVGLICMFIFWKTLKYWVQDYPYIVYALCPTLFILVVVLTCCDQARRKVPYNYILLGLFTVVEGCVLGTISALFDADAVMWAAGATVVVTLGLTIFALQTKWDFTILSGGTCVMLLVLLSFGALCAILRSFWLEILYASIGTFIFGMYLVVDTQLIIGGKQRYSIDPEEYIFAALNIYLDIVSLFLMLLQLFGLCR
ncbi:protein lifeguard 2-like [Rhinophrynus dorsalis]